MNDIIYAVVQSEDGRYSIWPKVRPVPWGWMATGFEGQKEACLDHIETAWTDQAPTNQQGHP